jgi:hypothetical protein
MSTNGISIQLPQLPQGVSPNGNNNTLLFLRPILTPEALRIVQAQPILLGEAIIWLFVCIALIGVVFYISFVTNKPYKKPAEKKSGQGKRWDTGALLGKVKGKVNVNVKIPFLSK